MKIKRGSTSVRRLIFVGDSSSTTGAGLANLLHNTSGLVAYYFAGDLSNEVQITLATATLGSYTSGGFIAVDNTNMPGWYEIGIPDAALDGGNEVAIQLRGAANMVPVNIYIELDAVDYQDATAFGLSRIDAAVSSRMATYTQPNGFLAATFPTTVASTTNITSATGVVLAATTHTGAVIPTVSTVTNAVTAGTVTDKTGYSLTQAFPSNFSSLAITVGGAVTVGTNNDKTGYSLTQSFPANFASMSIDASGRVLLQPTQSGVTIPTVTNLTSGVTVATNNDKTGYSLSQAFPTHFANMVISANGHVTATVDSIANNSITASSIQGGAITAAKFASGAIDANALAADAATEVATAVGTLQVLTDLVTMIVNDGTANARFSTSALQNAPSGGGGSATVNVLPYTGAVPDRVEGTTIKVFYNELTNVSVGVTDATGAAVTLDAKTLRFCVEDRYGADVLTLNDGDITRSGSTFTVQIPQSLTDTVGANYRWSLRDLTSSLNTVLIHGQMIVAEAAEDEA